MKRQTDEPGVHFKGPGGWWRSFRAVFGYVRATPKRETEWTMCKEILRDTMLFRSRDKRYIAGGIVFWVCLVAAIACFVKIYMLWKSINALQ